MTQTLRQSTPHSNRNVAKCYLVRCRLQFTICY